MTCTVEITLHALSQRSPARSGIENSWPKGKAKVKGRSSYKQLLHPVLESHAKVLLLYFHKNGAVFKPFWLKYLKMYLRQILCKRLHNKNAVFNSKKSTSKRKRSYICIQKVKMVQKIPFLPYNNVET